MSHPDVYKKLSALAEKKYPIADSNGKKVSLSMQEDFIEKAKRKRKVFGKWQKRADARAEGK